MTLKTYARKWLAVLLAVAVLLPTLAVYLPVTAAEAENYGLQTFDGFEAKKYDTVDGTTGIAGNGEGRIVSADYDHTTGSGKSIKLEMKGYQSTASTPQTVALGADGTRLLLTKGKTYTVSVWLYSATDVSLKYRLASVKQYGYVGNPAAGYRTNEHEEVISLTAGTWQQVTVDVTLAGLSGQDTAYLTIGATYADSTVTATSYVYLDDLWVGEYVNIAAMQTYEAYDAKKYDAADGTTGIAGNGDGREISNTYNHTPGGSKSVKLLMNGYKSVSETPQTVVLTPNGTRMLLSKGSTYTVSAWLYSETAGFFKYRIASVAQPNNVSWGTRQLEKEVDVELAAGTWQQVTVDVTLAGLSGQNTAYLTIGATYADSSVTSRAYLYLDDVQVKELAMGVATREQDFDRMTNGESVGLQSVMGARVSDEKDHTGVASAGQSLKVAMTTSGGTAREQFALLNSYGEPMLVETGKTYSVSMWVYITGSGGVNLNYWVCSSSAVSALTDKSGAEYDRGTDHVWTATNQWVKVNFTMTKAAANGPYLIFGITTADANTVNRTVYIDDMEVTDTSAAVSEQNYETMAAGTSVALRGEGAVSAEQNHTANGSQSARVLMDSQGGTARTQMALLNSHALPMQVEVGNAYEVSMWVYVEDNASTVALNYWLCSSPSATALNDKTNAEYDMGAGQTDLPTGSWQQLKITVNSINNGPYLIFGITTRDANENHRYIYIDDVVVAEYTPPAAFTYGLQDYESYEAIAYPAEGDGIHGNGSGREVSTEQNHTPGGQKSIRLNVNNSLPDYYARTVLPLDGTDFLVKRGDCYTVSFWLYSETEREVAWYVGSTMSATNLYAGKNDAEQQGTVSLPAGEWAQVTANVNVTGHYSSNTAYLTIGALFDGCVSNPASIYLDDVELVVPDDLVTVTFHSEGGSAVENRKTFAGEPLGYLAPSTRVGYLFAGWHSADGSTFYTENTMLPNGVTALELYAQWVQVPDAAQSLVTGFEESDYTAVPYTNDDPTTAVLRSNMTASATWMKDAGFSAETGDGAMRLVNDPFVQETSNAYQAFALMNADGTPFVVKRGAKYRITYSYRGDELDSAHSYVSAYVSADAAFTGVGTGDQQLTRDVIHGIELDWQQVDECFLAEGDGYVYFTFCARSSTSESSSRYHAVYIDNVTVEVLDDTYSVVTFRCNGTVINRVGKTGSPLRYPGFSVASGKELEGWYTDTAYTQKFTADVYPAQDTILYGRIVSGDYDTDIVYVEDSLTLDFEDDSLPTFYSAKNHMTYGNDYIDFVTGDADEAHSSDSYMRLNAVSFNYFDTHFMLYNPEAPHNLLYLKPNSSYRVSFYVKVEEDFMPFNSVLCLGDPSGIGQGIQDTYIVSANVVAGEWVLAETIVVTGDEPAVLSVNPPKNDGAGGTSLTLLDDFTILKLYDVTVTFDTNGGDLVAPVVTSLASTIEPPIAPYRMGYEFRGWYTDKELKNAFDFATPIMEDMTLYARWRQVTADEDEEGTTGGTDPSGNAGTDTPSAPVDTPVTEPMMDTGDRPTFNPAATPEVPADEPTEQPTPEGTFSVQMLLIVIAIVVVLVGGGALTVLLLRKKKKTNEEEG